VLRVQDLVLGYGEVAAVEKVSLEVSSGKFVSLVGPSGSGKTSILRAINGLLMPRSGRVELDGGQESLGFLFQDDALLPWRTADENVALGLRIRKMSKSAALAEADSRLNRLGLEGLSNRYPHELSGGQRKRVAIAQVLALKPKLVDRVRTLGMRPQDFAPRGLHTLGHGGSSVVSRLPLVLRLREPSLASLSLPPLVLAICFSLPRAPIMRR
jgi:ABC-type arginine transport system ATPase subunit